MRKDISFKRIAYVSSADVVIIKSSNLRSNIFIASVQTFFDDIYRLCDFRDGFHNDFHAGNFTARHPIYGDIVTSNRGKILVNLMSSRSFRCLKEGSPTFIFSANRPASGSTPDLIFADSSIFSFSWLKSQCPKYLWYRKSPISKSNFSSFSPKTLVRF